MLFLQFLYLLMTSSHDSHNNDIRSNININYCNCATNVYTQQKIMHLKWVDRKIRQNWFLTLLFNCSFEGDGAQASCLSLFLRLFLVYEILCYKRQVLANQFFFKIIDQRINMIILAQVLDWINCDFMKLSSYAVVTITASQIPLSATTCMKFFHCYF